LFLAVSIYLVKTLLRKGFVSAALFIVVGFRNVAVMKHALYPSQDPVIKLQWQQNVWTVSRPTPPNLDANGQPINQCPQPPMIVERLVHMMQGSLGPGLTVFSGGESAGWVSPVYLGLGVSCVATEWEPVAFFYLEQRLLEECGQLILTEANRHQFWKKVVNWYKAHTKENLVIMEKIDKLSAIFRKSGELQGVTEQAARQIVENIASEIGEVDNDVAGNYVKRALVQAKAIQSTFNVKESDNEVGDRTAGTKSAKEPVEQDDDVEIIDKETKYEAPSSSSSVSSGASSSSSSSSSI